MRIIFFDSAGTFQAAKGRVFICSLIMLVSLAISVVFAGPAAQEEKKAGEQCIMCHVELYNSALIQPFTHSPFFEQQCVACHLAAGRDVAAFTGKSEPGFITGTQVSQEPLWRKQQKIGGDSQTFDHLVSLSGLNPEAVYRFRVLCGETVDQASASSLWLGLRSQELLGAGSGQVSVTSGLNAKNADIIEALIISSVAADAVIISWQADRPLYGWVELQLLENAEPLALDPHNTIFADQAEHPPLRDPAEAAINACYQCHPESTLGTSHPVRLYGGRDVRIPAELPTVDGMLTCVTCHDPHGAPGKMLVREIIKTKLCVTCHYKYKNSSPSTMFR